jgi:hypothetical protein
VYGQSPARPIHVSLVDWRSSPRHVHVFDKNGKLITRVNLETMEPMDIPCVDRKILEIIRELRDEGRL